MQVKLIILVHEKDTEVESELQKYLSRTKDIEIISNLSLEADKSVTDLREHLQGSGVVIITLSIDFIFDDTLYELWTYSIKNPKLEIIQILARPMLLQGIEHNIKTIPSTPLSQSLNKDADYIYIVEVITDAIQISQLRSKIEELEQLLKSLT